MFLSPDKIFSWWTNSFCPSSRTEQWNLKWHCSWKNSLQLPLCNFALSYIEQSSPLTDALLSIPQTVIIGVHFFCRQHGWWFFSPGYDSTILWESTCCTIIYSRLTRKKIMNESRADNNSTCGKINHLEEKTSTKQNCEKGNFSQSCTILFFHFYQSFCGFFY